MQTTKHSFFIRATNMAVDQNALNDDALYCHEVEEEEEDDEESVITSDTCNNGGLGLGLASLLEQDLFWDDKDLKSLFNKERESRLSSPGSKPDLSLPRKQALEWILRTTSYHGFCPLTPILAANYLNRFIDALSFNTDKPWMMQLAAVACLSLAAKVEETHVPLLLDFQVEGAEYVFDAKTIQRMELLVLSSLKWRMNPVTPLSFIHHIIRRLGLKTYAHWEFLMCCENLLLSLLPDPRFTLYLPSVMATATMLHVIHQVEPGDDVDYENQLLSVLKISKEEVAICYQTLSDILSNTCGQNNPNTWKRKISTNLDAVFSLDGSSCVSSSAHQPTSKKRRVAEQGMRLPSMNGFFVTASPN